MIVFSGQPAGDCQEYMLKREAKVECIAALIVFCIFLPLIIWMIYIYWVYSFIILPFILFIVLASQKPKSNLYNRLLPDKITIADKNIESESEKFYETREIDDVLKVIDMGDWYFIKFYFPNKSQRFVCQKNLITEGTIDEFEAIFKDKLVSKKIKTTKKNP